MKTKLLFLTIILFVSVCAASAQKPKAIDFTLKDLSDKNIKLSDYRGKVVFLNFWATWCPPCKAEMPSMQKLYASMKNEKFVMLAVNVENVSSDVINSFALDNKYTFPILLDPKSVASSQYKIFSIPTTFIIDKKGFIVNKVVGSNEWDNDSAVSELIKLCRAK